MVRPKEVLITIDDDGELVDNKVENYEEVNLYETMKTVISNVTRIDPKAMRRQLTKKFNKLKSQEIVSFQHDKLSRFCWTLGSITGYQNNEDESKLIVFVVEELLKLTKSTKRKTNKAQVATNMMFIMLRFP